MTSFIQMSFQTKAASPAASFWSDRQHGISFRRKNVANRKSEIHTIHTFSHTFLTTLKSSLNTNHQPLTTKDETKRTSKFTQYGPDLRLSPTDPPVVIGADRRIEKSCEISFLEASRLLKLSASIYEFEFTIFQYCCAGW
jgi:hypothetical protein